jgi:hypothetical protein
MMTARCAFPACYHNSRENGMAACRNGHNVRPGHLGRADDGVALHRRHRLLAVGIALVLPETRRARAADGSFRNDVGKLIGSRAIRWRD